MEIIQTPKLYRAMTIDRIDNPALTDRTVALTFSSEQPVKRWFGNEILGHAQGNVDVEFIGGGTAPLLLEHDSDDQIGVVETVVIGADRKGRATVRFGKSDLASEILTDVKDLIRSNVSVGYRINEMILEKTVKDVATYRVIDWTPLEISIVPIPADTTVGIGRAAEGGETFPTIIKGLKKMANDDVKTQTTPQIETRAAAPVAVTPVVAQPVAVNVAQARADENLTVRNEIADILALGAAHNDRDGAEEHIRTAKNLDQYKGYLLNKIGDQKPLARAAGDLDLSAKDNQRYSLMRAINAAAKNDWRGAEYEREASDAIAKRAGKDPNGFFVPYDALSERALTVGVPASGGNLVGTDYLGGSFIDALRNRMVLRGLGAMVLSGLKGDVTIPGFNGTTSATWVAENGAPPEGTPTFRQVPMSPKTIAAFVNMSRKLMQQSDPSIEALIRGDIVSNIAIAIDTAGIKGGGVNEPTGILATAGIGAVVGGVNGAAMTWGNVVDLVTQINIDNADVGNMSYLTNSKVVGKLNQTQKVAGTDSRMVMEKTDTLYGYSMARTEGVPSNLTKGTGTNLSACIFGNFHDLVIGEWGVIDLLVNPYSNDTTGATRVTAFMDVDIAVRRAVSFAAMQDIITI